VCCSKYFEPDELSPARVLILVKQTNMLDKKIEDATGLHIERAGMVCKGERGGRNDSSGNRILKVVRKGIKVKMEESARTGQPFFVEEK
jgi:hypothetical protein